MPIAMISELVPVTHEMHSPGMYILADGSVCTTPRNDSLLLAPGLVPLSPVPLREQWTTRSSHSSVQRKPSLVLLETEDLLFVAWSTHASQMMQATERAYKELFATLTATGFRHPLRIWNFLGHIHSSTGTHDHYQDFCVGRARALDRLGITDDVMPAATAIGTDHPGLYVYLLAAREPGTAVENPRQISAYHYPKQYSPERPAFARATRIATESGIQLLISGTASIVGHESLHPGDPEEQTLEILRNLDAVKQSAGMASAVPIWLRVYLRHPQHLPFVESILLNRLGQLPPVQWIRGDICREDLLLEIEGVYR